IPTAQDKVNPLTTTKEEFYDLVFTKNMDCFKAIYTSFTGISPVLAHEICYRSGGNADRSTAALDDIDKDNIYQSFSLMIDIVKNDTFTPNIVYKQGIPTEYAAISLSSYDENMIEYDSISSLLEQYYAEKNMVSRIRQKSVDLRKIVQIALERTVKKYDLQLLQMKDTEKKDKFKVYGELITAYGYNVPAGSRTLEALNYYDGKEVSIPLDPTISPIDNAKKYFNKYAKLKRTYEALSSLTIEVKNEIDHLESISNALDIAQKEEDLIQIKEELIDSGYIRRKGFQKKQRFTSKPFHYISSDGYHMYVGKNNYQNEDLTFKFATGNDWWFHAKGIPGSHVVVKSNGDELPDRTFEEAGRLAAFYSKGKGQEKVEIDYTQKKNVKKPSGGKPGFVVYYTNYSLMIDSQIDGISLASE
ncbi:MAG: NFACT RNA binding domain-containing protein, partial [Eubacteriales bacterium]